MTTTTDKPRVARAFIATVKCAMCGARVRVYDWLPEAVLCATHQREIARSEAAAMSDDSDVEEGGAQ